MTGNGKLTRVAISSQAELGAAPAEWLEGGGDEQRLVGLARRSALELAA
jgi:hypothetical protein